MGIHIAHWKISGNTIAPLEFNEVLYTLHLGIITAGFIFMVITMIATLVAGRFFCSWMCHMLALQDASEWILKKMRIKPVAIRSRTLLWIPFILMAYLFIWPQIERVYLDLPSIEFQMMGEEDGWASFMTNNFWRNLPGIGITLFTFFICGFAIVYLLGSRSFCQSACPYGALFFIADKIAPGKIKLTGDCNQCGICTSVCSSHIQVHKEIKHFGKVVDGNCLKDMDCVQACPNDAIKFGFTKPSFFQTLNNIPGEKKRNGLSLKEDLMLLTLFVILLFAYRGLYDSVPLLLAVALSIIIAAMIVLGFRLYSSEYVHLNKLILKHSNNITPKGRLFLLILAGAVIISVHSGFIRYHQIMGDINYNKIATKSNHSNIISKTEFQHYYTLANDHLDKVYEFGFYAPASLNRQLASLYITGNRKVDATFQLEQLIQKMPDDVEARHRYAKLLSSNNDVNAALHQLEPAVSIPAISKKEKSIKSDALFTLGKLQEQQGSKKQALSNYQEAIALNPKNYDAILAAGILMAGNGNLNEAEKLLLKAELVFTSNFILENNLAVIYLTSRNYSKALEHLNKMQVIEPNNSDVKYNIIMTRFALGYQHDALNDMKLFANEYPGNKNAPKAIAMIQDHLSANYK